MVRLWWGPLLGHRLPSVCCVFTWQRERALWIPFTRPLIPSMGVPLYDIITSQRLYLILPLHWGLEFQDKNFGEIKKYSLHCDSPASKLVFEPTETGRALLNNFLIICSEGWYKGVWRIQMGNHGVKNCESGPFWAMRTGTGWENRSILNPAWFNWAALESFVTSNSNEITGKSLKKGLLTRLWAGWRQSSSS